MPTNNLMDSFLDSFASNSDFTHHNVDFDYLELLRSRPATSRDYLESIRSSISQEPTIDFSFDFGNRTDDKIKALEERIEKLEEMIGILLDKRG
jgi:hypothetical protein